MLDRLHEAAHRLLMQLYVWSGQRGAALHQYRECVEVLERELGVAPLEATTRLYQAIKERQEIPLPGPLRAPTAVVPGASVAVEAVSLSTASALLDTAPAPQAFPSRGNSPLVDRSAAVSTCW